MGNGKALRASVLQVILVVLGVLLVTIGGIYAGIAVGNRSKIEYAEKDIISIKQDVSYTKEQYKTLREEVLLELRGIRENITEIKKSVAVLEKGK